MTNKIKKGGTGTLIKIAVRNIGRNKRRTAFCLCAVGIAVFFIPIYGGMIAGMINSIDNVVTTFETGHVSVVSRQYEAEKEYMPVQYPVADGNNWQEVAGDIKSIPGVRAVLPRISTMTTLQESTIKHAMLWGIDIEQEIQMNNLNQANRNDGLVKGRWPANANECAVGVVFEDKSGLTIGDTIPLKTISAQFSDRYWSPEIVGIFNFDFIRFDERTIVADHDRLQRLLALGDGTQGLFIFADDKNNSGFIANRVEHIMGDDHIVKNWQDDYWVAVMKAATPMYTIIFMVFVIVASFLIVNTVVMIIHERIKEIGMMGSLGMSRGEIVKVFFFESVFLAILGSLIGVFAGGLVTGLLQNFPIRMGDLYGNTFADMPLSNTIFFVFSIRNLVQGFLMGVIIASLFTLIPSLRSAKVEPVEALRR